MEYCDHGCLSDAIKCGAFRAIEGQWDRFTSLRSLVRTAKEIAQVGEGPRAVRWPRTTFIAEPFLHSSARLRIFRLAAVLGLGPLSVTSLSPFHPL